MNFTWCEDFLALAASGNFSRAAEARLRPEGQGIHPHVVQLVGRNPRSMGEAARLAEASGADVVDMHVVGGAAQALRHAGAHGAQADHADGACCGLWCGCAVAHGLAGVRSSAM